MKTKCGTDILVCVGCRRCFVVIAMVLAAMTSGIAQHQHPTTTPEKPVALLAGLGSWRHPIATRNAEAQKFFDQGMTLIYGFNRPEALRSFHKASELDPRAAMAYWGIAMALVPDINMDLYLYVHLKEASNAEDAGLAGRGLMQSNIQCHNQAVPD